MIFTDSKLRLPIALLIAALLLGAGIFQFSLRTRLASGERLITEKTRAEQAARGVREAPARLIQERADAALFSRIRNSGFLGQEDRVGWVSALAQSQTHLQLGSLAWRMTPQMPSPLAPDLKISGMEFTASPLDPDKLTALIAHLRAHAPGHFTVERCTFTLDPNSTSGQADCRLNWWTLAQHDY
jgi:hypothetical protein